MPISVASPVLWAGFGLFVAFMLALDLGVFHRGSHEVHHKEALIWRIVWLSLALIFNGWIYHQFGHARGLEFLTAYVIEYALSVDNLFVFLLIFKFFRVPNQFQHRILFWGILGALFMRLTFILAGVAILHRFEWVTYLFGAVVLFAGAKMLKEEEVEVHPENNWVLKLFKKLIRTTTQDAGGSLMLRHAGHLYATPLLLVLIVVEATDVAFAVDSIPAVFAVTRDPFIAFSSNIFAILGLRSLYFLLASYIGRFQYLKFGLGLVLIFIGAKMVAAKFYEVPLGISLAIVGSLLGISILVSLLHTPKKIRVPPLKAEEPRPLPPWSRKKKKQKNQ